MGERNTWLTPATRRSCDLRPSVTTWGVGIAQWLERRTHDQKVTGLSPHRRIFFSRVSFLCWLILWYPFHPCSVACERSRSFCQKCRWQVTGYRLHTCTLRMWLGINWQHKLVQGWMVYAEWAWHQPCNAEPNGAVNTPLQWIFKSVP